MNFEKVAYLSSINIKNLQSWSDMTFNFVEGLNIISATNNNVGKSVLFKCVKLVINAGRMSSEERRQYISFGKSYAEMTFVFSDNFVVYVLVSAKTVRYFCSTDGENFVEYSEVPESFLTHMSIVKNVDGTFIANIIDLDSSRFLVDSDTKSNVELLKLLTFDENLNRVKETSKARGEEIGFILRQAKRDLDSVTFALNKLEYVDEDSLQTKERVISEAIKGLEIIGYLLNDFKNLANMDVDAFDYTNLIKELDLTKEIVNLQKDLKQYNSSDTVLKELSEGLDDVVHSYNITKDLFTLYSELSLLSKDIEGEESLCATVSLNLNIAIDLFKIVTDLNNVLLFDEKEEYVLKDIGHCLEVSTDCLEIVNNLKQVNILTTSIEEQSVGLFNTDINVLGDLTILVKELTNNINLDLLVKSDEEEIKQINKILDDLGGEEFSCPIHGTIKYIDGKCIPNNK